MVDTLEHHLGFRPGIEHGQVGGLATPLGLAQQQAWVDFAVIGQVKRDMAGFAEQGMLRQLAVQATRGAALFGRGKGAASIAQQAAQLRTSKRHGMGHGAVDPWARPSLCGLARPKQAGLGHKN
ncbi:hypothetical protein D3C85_1307970 [compost metagenome]